MNCEYHLVCPKMDNTCNTKYLSCLYREFKHFEEEHNRSLTGEHSQLERKLFPFHEYKEFPLGKPIILPIHNDGTANTEYTI